MAVTMLRSKRQLPWPKPVANHLSWTVIRMHKLVLRNLLLWYTQSLSAKNRGHSHPNCTSVLRILLHIILHRPLLVALCPGCLCGAGDGGTGHTGHTGRLHCSHARRVLGRVVHLWHWWRWSVWRVTGWWSQHGGHGRRPHGHHSRWRWGHPPHAWVRRSHSPGRHASRALASHGWWGQHHGWRHAATRHWRCRVDAVLAARQVEVVGCHAIWGQG